MAGVRTNLITNPSFETAITPWSGTRATFTRVASGSAYVGGSVGQLVNDATVSNHYIAVAAGSRPAAAAGTAYTFSYYARLTSGAGTNRYARMLFFDAGGVQIGAAVDGPKASITAAGWTRLSLTATAPAGTVTVNCLCICDSGNEADVWAVDGLLLEAGAAPGAYFDGDTPDMPPLIDYAWTGTAHASTSTSTDSSVIVTFNDKNPTRLRLVISNPSGNTVGSIVRSDPNGTRTVRVESGVLPSTAASLVVSDYEYPLLYGATITYTVYSPASVALGSLTIGPGQPGFNTERGLATITVPQRPATSVELNDQDGFNGSPITRWDDAREARHTVHQIVGREDPVVVLQKAATRTGTIEINCPDLPTAQRIEATLAQAQVFDLRQSDQRSLDLYFVPTSIAVAHSEDDWTPSAPGTGQPERRWIVTVAFTEVGWPTGYVTPVNVWTWNDVVAAHGDWNAVMATYRSWANLLERVPG